MIPTHDDVAAGRTLAEIQGFTAELGGVVLGAAVRAALEGDLRSARGILEGLLVTNPRDALAWALLSQVERRRGETGAALLCAEAAFHLLPGDARVRLARAEALLAVPAEAGQGREAARAVARRELEALQGLAGAPGLRASALLRALGP